MHREGAHFHGGCRGRASLQLRVVRCPACVSKGKHTSMHHSDRVALIREVWLDCLCPKVKNPTRCPSSVWLALFLVSVQGRRLWDRFSESGSLPSLIYWRCGVRRFRFVCGRRWMGGETPAGSAVSTIV